MAGLFIPLVCLAQVQRGQLLEVYYFLQITEGICFTFMTIFIPQCGQIFFLRTAIAGDSLFVMTSVAFTTSMLLHSISEHQFCFIKSSAPMIITVSSISLAA